MKTYSSNIKLFKKFCNKSKLSFEPSENHATVFDIISLYLASLCLKNNAFGTVRVYFYSIRAYYLDTTTGSLDVTKSYLITQVLHAIKLRIGDRPKQKLAITLELLSDIFRAKGTSNLDKRDWAAFALAFFGLFRHSEILGLWWKDIRYVSNGLAVWLAKSKTDPIHRGMWVYVGERKDGLCASHALAMLHKALDPFDNREECCVFPTTKNGKWTSSPLTGNAFSKRVKFWIAKLGLDPADYAGHSFRRGGATALFRAGIPSETIQAQGRWTSDCYKRYIETDAARFLALANACTL